jgi:hypothetical protein
MTVTLGLVAVIYVLTSRVLNKAASFAGSGVGLAGGISGRVQVQASSAYLSLEPSHAAAALPAISGNYRCSVELPQPLFWSKSRSLHTQRHVCKRQRGYRQATCD